jgi:hypothetical protein
MDMCRCRPQIFGLTYTLLNQIETRVARKLDTRLSTVAFTFRTIWYNDQSAIYDQMQDTRSLLCCRCVVLDNLDMVTCVLWVGCKKYLGEENFCQ